MAAALAVVGTVKAQDYVLTDSIDEEAEEILDGIIEADVDLTCEDSVKIDTIEEVTQTRQLSHEDSIIISRLASIPTTIEMPLNNVTRNYIDVYSNRFKSSVSVMLGAIDFYSPIFEEALEKYNLPLELKYLPVIESALRPTATSRVGAAGLWQFMPATGKRYGLEINTLVDERRDPIKSSEAAARYLRDLYDMFGDWGLAIAAYNCGERNIQKAIIRSGNQEDADYWTVYNSLPHETRGYVPAFIAANYIMKYYGEHGIVPREAPLPAESDTVQVASDVRLDRIAAVCGLTLGELQALNPQYRRNIVPANYSLRLPLDAVEPFLTYEDSIYNGDLKGLRRATIDDLPQYEKSSRQRSRRGRRGSTSRNVTVRNGDNLYAIAKRNGTTVAKLKRLNGIKGDRIRSGQKIRVK